MKQTKLVIALFLIMSVVLVGCGQKETTSTEKTSETATKTETKTEKKVDDAIDGKWEDNTYMNEYFDFKIELPNDWEKTSQENIKSDSDKDNLHWILKAKASNGNNLNIQVQNLKDYGAPAETIAKMTVDDFADLMIPQFESYGDGVFSNVKKGEQETIGKNSYGTITVDATFSGVNLKQKLYILKNGDYFVTMTFTAISSDDLATITKMLK